MTTFWIKPSLEELDAWMETAGDDAVIEVQIKCAVGSDDLIESVYRHKGLSKVNRAFVAELYSEQEIEDWIAENRAVDQRHRESGLYEAARQELEKAAAEVRDAG